MEDLSRAVLDRPSLLFSRFYRFDRVPARYVDHVFLFAGMSSDSVLARRIRSCILNTGSVRVPRNRIFCTTCIAALSSLMPIIRVRGISVRYIVMNRIPTENKAKTLDIGKNRIRSSGGIAQAADTKYILAVFQASKWMLNFLLATYDP